MDKRAIKSCLSSVRTDLERIELPGPQESTPISPDSALNQLELLRSQSKVYIRSLIGVDNDYYQEIAKPILNREHKSLWDYVANSELVQARARMISSISALLIEIEMNGIDFETVVHQEKIGSKSNRVFIVHGHNNEMKQATKEVVSRLGLKPVILHEQPDQGKTIIEKFEDYADVGFAIVLLSPDDINVVDHDSEKDIARPRQNVILELGFLIGKIGRSKVFVLKHSDPKLELPTDYSGVLYTEYDESMNWRFKLVKELQASEFAVNANDIL
jgi:hypothetical protein